MSLKFNVIDPGQTRVKNGSPQSPTLAGMLQQVCHNLSEESRANDGGLPFRTLKLPPVVVTNATNLMCPLLIGVKGIRR